MYLHDQNVYNYFVEIISLNSSIYLQYNISVLYKIIHLAHIIQEVIVLFNIDVRSSTPIYEQIIDAVKESIIKGILQPGDKLPSVRELASMLTTNPNTISKAYGELERLKIIETLRGKGTFVSLDYKPKLEEDKMSRLKEDLKKILLDAHYMGINNIDIKKILDELYSELLGDNERGKKDE